MSSVKGSPQRETKRCYGGRSSKTRPSYTVAELKKMIEQRFPDVKAYKLKKDEMCKKLGFPLESPLSKKSPKTPSLKRSRVSSPKRRVSEALPKLCAVKSTKTYIAYSKQELVAMARAKGYQAKQIQSMDKIALCDLLKLPKPEPKKAKGARGRPKAKVVIPNFEKIKVAKGSKEGLRCIKDSLLPLNPNQKEAVHFIVDNRGLISAHSTGAGKTLTAVTASECFLKSNPKGRVIFVAGVSLQENVYKEYLKYGVDIRRSKRVEVVTFHGFVKEYENKALAPHTFLIIDEAHNLRTPASGDKSSRSYVFVKRAMDAEKVLLLTASPVYNNPRDMANLLAMVRGEMPMGKAEFLALLTNPKKFKEYVKCTTSFYYGKRDPEHFPKVVEKVKFLVMSPEYYKEYHEVEKKKNTQFTEANPWVFLTGVRRATNALADQTKVEWAFNKIKEGKKTLVYSSFLESGIGLLEERLKKAKIPYVLITGSMKAIDRDKAVRKFNTDKVKVMLVTKAGGEGLDLKGVRVEIMLESPWNEATKIQFRGRGERYDSHIHLPPKERKMSVYYLALDKPVKRFAKDSKPSADRMVYELEQEKKKENDAFMKKFKEVADIKKC